MAALPDDLSFWRFFLEVRSAESGFSPPEREIMKNLDANSWLHSIWAKLEKKHGRKRCAAGGQLPPSSVDKKSSNFSTRNKPYRFSCGSAGGGL